MFILQGFKHQIYMSFFSRRRYNYFRMMSHNFLKRNGALIGAAVFTFTVFVFVYKLDLILPIAPRNLRTKPSTVLNISYAELWRKMRTSSTDFPPSPVLNQFRVAMTEEEYNLTMHTLEVFAKVMSANNLTYFQYGGTLIGSVRYHGPIPWDDDIDLLIDNSKKAQILRVLKSLEPEFFVQTSTTLSGAWKFWSRHARQPVNAIMPWKWPYLDLWFFQADDEAGLVRDVISGIDFPKDLIFPLRPRPFGRINLMAPCASVEFLRSMYNMDNCISRDFNHQAELPDRIVRYKVPCTFFDKYFPYVIREESPNGVSETLIFQNSVIQRVPLSMSCANNKL